MARITVEDCIRHYPNRFELVQLAARRARQLLRGFHPLVDDGDAHKPPVQALKEIGAGQLTWDRLFELEEQERRRLEAAQSESEEEESVE